MGYRRGSVVLVAIRGSGRVPFRSASGQGPEWTRVKVVTKVPPQVEGRSVDENDVYRIYEVKRHEGDRVWLASDELSGWVPAREVMPLDTVETYFWEPQKHLMSAKSYVMRGLARAEKNKTDEAIDDFTEAIIPRPRSSAPAFRASGAVLRADKNEYDKAIADYDEAIRHPTQSTPQPT